MALQKNACSLWFLFNVIEKLADESVKTCPVGISSPVLCLMYSDSCGTGLLSIAQVKITSVPSGVMMLVSMLADMVTLGAVSVEL